MQKLVSLGLMAMYRGIMKVFPIQAHIPLHGVYTMQAFITCRPFSASNLEKKGCSAVQHASKID